jgi:UDP-N-acetylglucosamine pyrophosphorylase
VLKYPTTIPPTIPEIIPEKSGAPDANAIPKHNGKATKKTTKPAEKSVLKFANKFIFFDILKYKMVDIRKNEVNKSKRILLFWWRN